MVFRPSALVLEVWEEDFCAALVVALGCDAEAAASIPAIVEGRSTVHGATQGDLL